ncbi:hypothetical protein [Streptomyces cacaoi]|uniref:hypothetical protein n=1 Tax=Streptomyces cacaoi TaxID=1898 RepID=UPI00260B84D8|nr:hypothetical protein [Streptomyces cacaoi]
MNEPIVYADQWRAVMQRAGYRCECVGQCGSKHAKGDGRCEKQHGKYADKHHGPARLLTAPTDPTLPLAVAVAVPTGELRAWCEGCHAGAARATRKARHSRPDQGGLFDL